VPTLAARAARGIVAEPPKARNALKVMERIARREPPEGREAARPKKKSLKIEPDLLFFC
jgi:hypothetical protein